MDFATRFPEAVPVKKIDAPTVCEQLLTVFSRYGLPDELLSVRGANFLAKVTEELLKKLGIKHLKTSPYHPQSNGMLERFHSTLKSMIGRHAQMSRNGTLGFPICYLHIESPHSVTGFSPFELLFGRDVRGPLTILKEQ